MKYETPELTALTPAINAVQTANLKQPPSSIDGFNKEVVTAYMDWES